MPPNNPTPTPAPVSTQVKANRTNYAGAVFFTMLIVGFTLRLPGLLYLPVVFFCVAAGIIFFKDVLSSRSGNNQAQQITQDGVVYVKPKRSLLKTIGIVILCVVGTLAIGYVGLIILVMIMLGAGGGF